MKSFKTQAAQGDLFIRKMDKIPEGLTQENPEKNGTFILAHSETGHHHVIEAENVQVFKQDEFISYMNVSAPTEVKHLRSFDTHEALKIDPGVYRIARQREYTPEGYRRAAD